jgi:hypothetical protein
MPHCETLPAETIKAIYFGLRMAASVRQEIQSVLDGHTHIQKFEMDLDPSTYKLIPIPVVK